MKNRNFFEAAIIHTVIDNFIKSGIKPRQIGVVTTSVDQQTLLQKQLNHFTIKVHLLDKLQGVNKDILLISSVKHQNMKELRRMYVAFSHAAKKLILVGSIQQLREVEPIDQFVAFIKKKNWVIDINNAIQFKKFFPAEASKYLTILNPGKADTLGTSRHPNTLAYLGSHQSFADENQIVYHIDAHRCSQE